MQQCICPQGPLRREQDRMVQPHSEQGSRFVVVLQAVGTERLLDPSQPAPVRDFDPQWLDGGFIQQLAAAKDPYGKQFYDPAGNPIQLPGPVVVVEPPPPGGTGTGTGT